MPVTGPNRYQSKEPSLETSIATTAAECAWRPVPASPEEDVSQMVMDVVLYAITVEPEYQITSGTRLVEDLGADDIAIRELLYELSIHCDFFELRDGAFKNDQKTYDGKTIADLVDLVCQEREQKRLGY